MRLSTLLAAFAFAFATACSACSASSDEAPPALEDGTGGPGPAPISPQPQPTPGRLPSVDPSKVTVRALGAQSLELTGAPESVYGTGLRAFDVTARTAPSVADVAADGSFVLVVAGAAQDRLYLEPLGHGQAPPLHAVVKGSALASADECLSPMFSGVAPDAPLEATLTMSSACSLDVALDAAFVSGSAAFTKTKVAAGMAETLTFTLAAPLASPLIFVLTDEAGVPRVGGIVDPPPVGAP